ncbi:MAG: glycosyltransferase family 4 protein [Pleurocapsa sp.]
MKLSFVNQPWTIAAPPQGSDSTGIWSYRVSRHLREHCQIIYYGCPSTADTSADSIEYREISGKVDKLLKIPRALASRLNFKPRLPYFSSAWFYFGYGWQVARDAARRNCKIIHIHNHSQFVPIIRAYNPHAKIVLHLHCEWVNRLDRTSIASRLQQLDLVIGCSDYITNKIAQRFPEYAGICCTVNNGVDANYFVPPLSSRPQNRANVPHLLFVGRISPEKGIHDLIEAFIQVTEQYPQAVLTIVGPHIVVAKEFLFDLQPEPEVRALEAFYSLDYLQYLKSRVPSHLSSQIIFVGSLPQNQLLSYYHQADVVINPSLSEAFGMSLVEAMATGTPVIATTIGGMPEIVDDGTNGLLVGPGNPQALARATVKLISDPVKAQIMGQAGRKKVLQSYSWEQITNSLISCYADIGVNVAAHDSEKAVTRSLSSKTPSDRTSIDDRINRFGNGFFPPSR